MLVQVCLAAIVGHNCFAAGLGSSIFVLLACCFCLQGRFKRPVAADALCMGQEFVKAAANMNPWIGEIVLTAAAKVFSNSTKVTVPMYYVSLAKTSAQSSLCTVMQLSIVLPCINSDCFIQSYH